jgi:hypothetical protein
MKSTTQLNVNSVPIQMYQDDTDDSQRGLLTSNYKEQIKTNFRNLTGYSLSNLKQRVKTNQDQLTSVTGTILKVSVFVIAYLIAFV